MPKFKFTYDSLIKYRESRLLMAKKELFKVESDYRKLLDARDSAVKNRTELLEAQRNSKTHVSALQLFSDLIGSETTKFRKLSDEMLSLEKEVDRHKNWVAHLGRELKIIERLKEKRKIAFEKEKKIREQKEIDNWVSQEWTLRIAEKEEEGGNLYDESA